MTEVIRPALYGAYHHVELTEPAAEQRDVFDVVGRSANVEISSAK